MDYREAVQFFDQIQHFSKDPSNDNVAKILQRFGNPESRMKFFHVAGTNGKGSVCAFLDSILQKGGYRTALFTSPHLVKINERIKMNGQDISDEDFAYYFEKIQQAAKEPLSFFDYLFLMAILYFSDQKADYCILETGLGGTYDPTNVVTPEISIITSIGLDHVKILGNTLEEIAAEKAGIIKKGKPIVYFSQTPEVNRVIEEKADKNHSKIIKLSKEDIKIKENHKKCIAISLESGYHRFNDLKIFSYAEYQLWNADIAVHAVKEIIPGISDEAIRSGIETMRWPARMEEIEPGVILDGAHNPHAVQAWVRSVRMQFSDRKKDLLFAVVADKDYEEMISIICKAFFFERIIITCIPGRRKANPLLIKDIFERYTNTEIMIEEDVSKAYAQAKKRKQDCLFCLGSLYLAGMIEELLI